MVDIVIPYVDDANKKWIEQRQHWEKEENINTTDEQTNPNIRYRSNDCFKYIFRSIDKNCPWVNKVFLILEDETHIPSWLNVNNPKLRIVYHKEYIPEELLPTYNSNTIEFFLYRIEDLSDTYILANDDTYFMKPVGEEFFFRDKKPVYELERSMPRVPYDIFNATLVNNQQVIKALCGKDLWWVHRHQATPHIKSTEKAVIENNLEFFINGFNKSRFRSKYNFTPWLWNELYKSAGWGVNVPGLYKNSQLVEINPYTDFNIYNNCELVCLNDTKKNIKPEVTNVKMKNWLESKFSEVSSYES